jgi:hypothetical protein
MANIVPFFVVEFHAPPREASQWRVSGTIESCYEVVLTIALAKEALGMQFHWADSFVVKDQEGHRIFAWPEEQHAAAA